MFIGWKSQAGSHRCLGVLCLLLGLGACGGDKGDSGTATLPPETGAPSGGDGGDTAEDFTDGSYVPDTGYNQVPETTLAIAHIGHWQQTPVGGPYAAMTGEIVIEELLNGNPADPWCRATFALTGLALDAGDGCDSCDASYLVEFFLVSEGVSEEEAEEDPDLVIGGLADCYSPDLPQSGDRWRMGWSELDGQIYFDFYDSGIWLPWYGGESNFDRVEFSWVTTAGFHLPEMDD